MSTDETAFPSITFPATFEGTAAIGADFSATLKLKTGDGPAVLRDLKGLPRGTYDVTIVSRQAAIAGDTIDRQWADMELAADEDGILDYEPTCLGSRCPHFAVATAGELEGAYVCTLDPEAQVKIVHGETECPLFPAAEPEGNGQDDGVDELPTNLGEEMEEAPEDTQPCRECDGDGRLPDKTGGGHHQCKACKGTGRVPREDADKNLVGNVTPVVVVLYPGSDDPHVTEVGPFTRYSELVADYLTSIGEDFCLDGWQVVGENDILPRPLSMDIPADDYGKRLVVEMAS